MRSMNSRSLLVVALALASCSRDLDLPVKPGDESFVSGRVVEAIAGTDQSRTLRGATVTVLGSNLHAVTDDQGTFVLGPLPAGKYQLYFAARSADDSVRQRLVNAVQLTRGATRPLGDISMQENAQVGGRALLDRRPTGNVGVLVFVPGTDFVTSTADSGGWMLRNLPAGTVRVSAYRPGFTPATTSDIDLQGGLVTSAADLVLLSQPATTPGSLTGTVQVMGAADHAGVSVVARSVTLKRAVAELTTPASGAFAFHDLAPDLYTLEVSRAGYPSARVPNLAIGAAVALDLVAPIILAPLGTANVASDAGVGPGLVVDDAGVEPTPDAGVDAGLGPVDAGPPPDAGPAGTCLTDDHCPAGLLCVDRECVNCSATVSCKPGFTCHTGACLKDCQGNGSCPGGGVCTAGSCGPCQTSAECGDASLVCNAQGECGRCQSRAECPAGKACLATGCGTCANDLDCGAGALCELGACVTGDCHGNVDCPSTQACRARACSACTADGQCRAGQLCLNGACSQANCRGVLDCTAGQVCLGNLCGACAKDADCGAGQLCLPTGTGNRCSAGTCRVSADCTGSSAGQVCNGSNQCVACTASNQCGAGQVCSGAGRCVAGDCLTASDCTGSRAGFTCTNNQCTACSGTVTCGSGEVCSQGQCKPGNCVTATDCAVPGQLCSANVCVGCTTSAQCGAGRVCGADSVCHAGQCAASPDCVAVAAGKVCNGSYQCVGCTSDAQCLPFAGTLCVPPGNGLPSVSNPGTCNTATCRVNADCTSGQACVNNQCAACRVDGDCASGQLCLDVLGTNTCVAADCRVNTDCVGANAGLVCNAAHRCVACATRAECADATKVCDTTAGRCITGNCVGTADCVALGQAGKVCKANACVACSLDGDCATGQLCIASACKTATCKDGSWCGNGAQICELGTTHPIAPQYSCRPCAPLNTVNSADCGGAGKVCDSTGTCKAGSCSLQTHCLNGLACVNNACSACSTDAQCGGTMLCVGSKCLTGTCHGTGSDPNADCSSTQVCVSNFCVGNCRASSDCLGTVANPGTGYCDQSTHACSACTSSAQCGGVATGKVCAGGACVTAQCTLATATPNDAPCPQGQSCQAGACVQVAPALLSSTPWVESTGVSIPTAGQTTATAFAQGKSRVYFSSAQGGNNVVWGFDRNLQKLWSTVDNNFGDNRYVGSFTAGVVAPAPGFPGDEIFITPQGANGGQWTAVAHRVDTGAVLWNDGSNAYNSVAISLVGGVVQLAKTGLYGNNLVLQRVDGTRYRNLVVPGCPTILGLLGGTASLYLVCDGGLLGFDPVTDTVQWSVPFTLGTGGMQTYTALWRPPTATGDVVVVSGNPIRAIFVPDPSGGPVTPTQRFVSTTGAPAFRPLLIDDQGSLYVLQTVGKLTKLSMVDGTVQANLTLPVTPTAMVVAADGTLMTSSPTGLLSGLSIANGPPGTATLLWQIGNAPQFANTIPTLQAQPATLADGGVVDGGVIDLVQLGTGGQATTFVQLVVAGKVLAPSWPAWGYNGDPAFRNLAPAYQCAVDTDCPATQGCVAGRCLGNCRDANGCAAGLGCQLGQCGTCTFDSACRAGEVCSGGNCYACDRGTNPSCCSSSAECSSGTCVRGTCRAALDPVGPGSFIKTSNTTPSSANFQIQGTDGTLYIFDNGANPTLRAYGPTGTLLWQSVAAPGTPWQTPMLYNVGGQDVIVAPSTLSTQLLVATVSPAAFGMWKMVSFNAVANTGVAGVSLAQGLFDNGGTPTPALFMAQVGRLWALDAAALATGALQVLWQLNTVGCTDSGSYGYRLMVGSDSTLYYLCQDGQVQAYSPDGVTSQPVGLGRPGLFLWSAGPTVGWGSVNIRPALARVPGNADVLYVSHSSGKQTAVLRVARAGLVSRTEVPVQASLLTVADDQGVAWAISPGTITALTPSATILGEWNTGWTVGGGNTLLTNDGLLWFTDTKTSPWGLMALQTGQGASLVQALRVLAPANVGWDAVTQLSFVPATLTGTGKALVTADDNLTSLGYSSRQVLGMPWQSTAALTQWGTQGGDPQHRASLKTQ